MSEQLGKLAEISQRANVTLQILPLASFHPISTGAFALFRFNQIHGVIAPDVVYLENMTDSLYIEDEIETYYYQRAFDHISQNSLGPDQSRELILQIRNDVWR